MPIQRAGNGYIRGDFGAGSVAGNCSVGDTCTVSNTFTNSGYGTVKPGADIVSNNKGIWENSGGVGNGNMNKVSTVDSPLWWGCVQTDGNLLSLI